MKKLFTTTILVLISLIILNAQLVVVNSPASIAGSYEFTAANFGADLTTQIWTGNVEFVSDNSANPTEGCDTSITDLSGKIALIDRGSCEFGLKCLNAEMKGAIAAIVFNNTPGGGLTTMAPGAVGGSVTIPCVFLSYEDGQIIRAELLIGPVNISLGDIRFSNDLSSSLDGISNARPGTVPGSQIEGTEDFSFIPGALLSNNGINKSSNVILNATVGFSPIGGPSMLVYDESGQLDSLEVDSSELLVLPDFRPPGEGFYDVTYTISSDSTDDNANDNEFNTSFSISQNTYSKTTWDMPNNRPSRNAAFTISGGGPIEFLSAFHVPNGVGFKIDSVQVYVSTSNPSLDGVSIEVYVYDWQDLNADSTMNNDEFTAVAFNFHDFENTGTTGQWITLGMLDFDTFEDGGYVIPENDKNYVVGVRYQGGDLVFFGFDTNYDLTQYLNVVGDELTDLDWPYIGINAWDGFLPDVDAGFLFTDFRATVSTGLIISEVSTSVNTLNKDQIIAAINPNPVQNELTLELNLKEESKYVRFQITDINGQEVLDYSKQSQSRIQEKFDVSNLMPGTYLLNIAVEQGIKSLPFIVQR